MKTKLNETQLAQISELQARFGITRKSAIRRFKQLDKSNKKFPNLAAAERDYKQAAANDTPELTPAQAKRLAAPGPKRSKKSVVKKAAPVTAAGSARAEGLRLYALSGRPKKADFIWVFGKPGVAWTWEARAKAVGLGSAEECAKKFQSMRAKPAGSCLVKDEAASKGAVA